MKASSIPTVSGTKVSATVKVSNPGARKAPSKALLYLVSGDDQVFSLGRVAVPAVATDKSAQVKVKRAAPVDVPAGKYAVRICFTPRPGGACRASRRSVTIEPAQLTASPATLNLGSVVPGATSSPQVITITNTGHSRTGPINAELSGSTAFKINSSECGPRLEPGTSCHLSVVFSPATVGGATGNLKVTGRRGATTSVPLTGTATGSAALAVSPTSYEFDPTLVGASSAAKSFVVTNTGNTAAGVPHASLDSTTAGFAITSDSCTTDLTPGATCTVSVRFTPTAPGRATEHLTVSSTLGGTVTSALAGTGLAPAALTLTPASATFGTAVVATTTTAQTFTLINTGDVASGVASITLSGADAAQFTIMSNTCAGVVAAGSSCDIDVAFAPTSRGPKTANLAVSAAPGGSVSAALSGTGQSAATLSIDTASYDFGYADTPTEKVFTITNNGDATSGTPTVALTGSPAFTTTSNTCTAALAGGASCTVGVTYTGTGAAQQSGQLSVAATPGGTVTAAVNGSPLALTITPASHDYGDVFVGTSSSAATFTLTNHRLTPVQVTGEGVTGPFDVENSCLTVTIAANGTCTFTGRFTPTSPGPATGTFTYSAAGSSADVELSGVGLTPAALSVAPTNLEFGAYAPGDTGTQVITVTNTGTQATTTAPTVTVTGADASDFSSQATTCNAPLAGGQSCTVTLGFAPLTLGEKSATATVNGTPATTTPSVAMTAVSAPPGVTIVPATYDFGSHAVGSSTFKTFRVVNTTENGAEINSVSSGTPFSLDIPGDFTCVLSVDVIQPHNWCTISIAFQPTTTGPFTRTLTAGGSFTATATMNGTGTPSARPSARASSSTLQPQPTSVEMENGQVLVRRD